MGEGLATLANQGRISHPSKEPRFLSTTTARNASAHHEWRSIPQKGIEVPPMAFSWRASWLHVLGRVFVSFDGLVDPASTPSFLLATCLYARVLSRVDVSLPRVIRGGLLGRSERFQDVFRHVIHVQFLQRREGTFHVQEGEQRFFLPFHAHFEATFPRFVWIDHHAHVFSRTFQQLLELVGPRLERTSGSTRFHDHGDVRVCGTAFPFHVFLASFHDVSLLLRRSCGRRRRGLALGRHADDNHVSNSREETHRWCCRVQSSPDATLVRVGGAVHLGLQVDVCGGVDGWKAAHCQRRGRRGSGSRRKGMRVAWVEGNHGWEWDGC